nr:hypothetical protein [Pseudomonas sp. GL-B-16]
MLRQKFNVVVEKTARELGGLACLELGEAAPPKQEICCSRMFEKRLHELPPIREAVAMYAARAAEKLREQGSVCRRVHVSIRTGILNRFCCWRFASQASTPPDLFSDSQPAAS